MPELDEEDVHALFPHKDQREFLMDFDFDLENSSWLLDQLPLASSNSNPVSPLLVPSSCDQQPFSPLWAFPDSGAGELAAGSRITDYPRFVTYTLESGTEDPVEDDDHKRRISSPFIGLLPNPDNLCFIKERMTQALRFFKECTEQHILAQVWAPVKNGSQYVLTTSGQPFVLGPNSSGLQQYRMVSLMYIFKADGENDGELGLPGRVFRQKLPEWTPNVQYYSDREFSRLNDALRYNVRGTLALPVFEPSGQVCVGVVELIMTAQKINYAPEVDKVCKALQAVNLKSSEILDHHTNTQICNEGRKNALGEILEILTLVCETHKLPLAQTWVPCRHRSVLAHGGGLKKSCSSFDGSCMGQVCMSTTDVAFYVVDAHMWGFREACGEHHLQKGQGVAGRAFLSQNSCFCRDITQFRKTEYPLVHYARMFGVTSCFAVCLRSSHTGDDDYVLEFFLPPSVKDNNEQQSLLGSLLATMRQHSGSMVVASGIDLEGERYVEFVQASANGTIDSTYEIIYIPESAASPSQHEASSNAADIVQLELSQRQLVAEVDSLIDGGTDVNTLNGNGNVSHFEVKEVSGNLLRSKQPKKTSERKRGKAEKTISLEVLRQYFSGSLKDAAKSLGVCPTTMKRICRQHGISRWPSRKINKVNRSLSKLKRVIESVQGPDVAFGLTSLATSPLPVAVVSWPPNMNMSHHQNSQGDKPVQIQGVKVESMMHKTPGGDGQDSMVDHFSTARLLDGELAEDKILFPPGFIKRSNGTKTGSGSREESAGSPTSHDSCHDSPANANGSLHARDHVKLDGSPEPPVQQIFAFSTQNRLVTSEQHDPFGRKPVEESGSSKDLKNLCPLLADAIFDKQIQDSSWTMPPKYESSQNEVIATPSPKVPHWATRENMKDMILKAIYRDDIIRFRIPISSSIVDLKEEVARRFRIEVGTFDIKYLDDDHEWVLIACDADLQECMDISILSGSNVVRLLVHEKFPHLGSSCESNAE